MSETNPEKKAEPESEARPKQAAWSKIGVVVTSLISAALVSVFYVFLTYAMSWPLFHRAAPAAPPDAGPTENAFQESIRSENAASSSLSEWRAVRSDHKAIAYTIAQCSKQDVYSLSSAWFSALLLDLRPNGDHYWSGTPSSQPQTASDQPKFLTSYARTVLFLSDAIGRARMQASAGADDNFPKMFWFSWLAVIISALGTLFITLRTSLSDRGGWTTFLTIAAISLSTAGTVLTSAKTFYDPAKAYSRNERALLELEKLHQDVMLHFVLSWDPNRCDVVESERDKQHDLLVRWVDELKEQHEGLVLAAVGDVPVTIQKAAEPISPPPPGPHSAGPAEPSTTATAEPPTRP